MKSLSPFTLKLTFIVVAILLDHFGMLSGALATMIVTAIGGTALTGAVQAFKNAPAPSLPTPPSLSPALVADLTTALGRAESNAQAPLPGVK